MRFGKPKVSIDPFESLDKFSDDELAEALSEYVAVSMTWSDSIRKLIAKRPEIAEAVLGILKNNWDTAVKWGMLKYTMSGGKMDALQEGLTQLSLDNPQFARVRKIVETGIVMALLLEPTSSKARDEQKKGGN